MMREERLFSGIYISGTALAIAFTMVMAEVYYVKVADIAPEVRRSTTYYLDFLPLKSNPNEGAPLNHEVFSTLFQKMKTPECVTGAIIMYHDQLYMKMADGLHYRAVTSKSVEPGYFRFYEYRFVQGAPFWGFIREAWLLTTVSVVIGCAIYFQFATAHGLYDGFTSRNPAVHLWFDDFGTHFLVVSAVVYIIILCTVLVGTAIPAWRICRSEITDALKEE